MSYRYAGIGSRETPSDVLALMTAYAAVLSFKGYILRSGGARGADTAFELGVPANRKEIFTVADATPAALEMAATIHPAWDKCTDYAKRLHARNCMIVLGQNLDYPVDFVICWTPRGAPAGGTGQAIRLANREGIKVFNMYDTEVTKRIKMAITSFKSDPPA